jgi:hypothetical protein
VSNGEGGCRKGKSLTRERERAFRDFKRRLIGLSSHFWRDAASNPWLSGSLAPSFFSYQSMVAGFGAVRLPW